MAFAIPKGTTNADQKTLDFYVGTAADPFAPQTTGVTGENARLRFGDNAEETSDNTIAAINASRGWYRLTLSDTEADNAVGPGSMMLDSSDVSGIAPVRVEFQIAVADMNTAAATTAEIADAFLDRNLATGTDSGSSTVRTVRQALRALRNRFTVAGGTATFYKEDDATVSHTAAVTGTPAVTEANPAGGS